MSVVGACACVLVSPLLVSASCFSAVWMFGFVKPPRPPKLHRRTGCGARKGVTAGPGGAFIRSSGCRSPSCFIFCWLLLFRLLLRLLPDQPPGETERLREESRVKFFVQWNAPGGVVHPETVDGLKRSWTDPSHTGPLKRFNALRTSSAKEH